MKKTRQLNYLVTADGGEPPGLGLLVAENDDRLHEYYVREDRFVAHALDVNDHTVFFTGPKGVGKSAILQMVRLKRKADQKRIIEITPEQLAFSAIPNMNATTPIITNAEQHRWLFRSLWDFVLSVEILRREHPESYSLKQFLKKWIGSRYEKQVQRLLEITVGEEGSPQSLTARVLQLVQQMRFSKKTASGEYEITAQSSAGSAGAEPQLELLSQINYVAANVASKIKHQYYILIDDLDQNWQDTDVHNALIASLFTSLRKLNKPPALKCVVAIRDDILRRLPLDDKDKIRDWVCTVKWDKATVRRILEERIRYYYRWSIDQVWGGMFPATAFDIMWRHSAETPRDLVRLAELCIEVGFEQEHRSVLKQDVLEAIKRFSEEVIENIASLHRLRWPGLGALVGRFSGWPKEFSIQKLDDFLLVILDDIESKTGSPEYSWAAGYLDNRQGLAQILLEAGIVQFKANRTSTPASFKPNIRYDFSKDSWLAIHPMISPALALVGH